MLNGCQETTKTTAGGSGPLRSGKPDRPKGLWPGSPRENSRLCGDESFCHPQELVQREPVLV
jgi:hypothetical protein